MPTFARVFGRGPPSPAPTVTTTNDDPLVPTDAHVGRTALTVADLDATVAFYRDVVGLAVLSRDDAGAELGVEDRPLLVLERDENAAPRRRTEAGLFHTAIRVPDRDALGAALERVREQWRLDGASDHYVSEALYLRDPEDNGVEIYADRPREEWPRGDDGRIEMGTVRLDVEALAALSDGSDRMPPVTDVGHVHLETTSVPAARSFYVDTLGLTVQSQQPSALFLAAGDYHHHIGVNAWNDRTEPAGDRGLAWVELVVPDQDALARLRRGLEESGVATSERPDGFAVTAPDDIRLRFRAARD